MDRGYTVYSLGVLNGIYICAAPISRQISLPGQRVTGADNTTVAASLLAGIFTKSRAKSVLAPQNGLSINITPSIITFTQFTGLAKEHFK